MVTACPLKASSQLADRTVFPLNQWYVAGFSSELREQPIGRTLLNQRIVMFRTSEGMVSALEDRCCHRSLPLSQGTVEAGGLRCGYHGLLYAADGQCIEIPGQSRIPPKAKVLSYTLVEQNQILWIWMPLHLGTKPPGGPPEYPHHDDPKYKFGSGHFHYDGPYQLIHDNLMDLSHLGYVHLKTIGGNAKLHMNTPMTVTSDENSAKVVRLMPGSAPPPTYLRAYPFGATCDRWQEIEFHVSYLSIWTGAVEPGTYSLDDPDRGGFHMRGLHGITPETESTSHYFWSMSSNKHPDMPETIDTVVEQTRYTFEEDRIIIEAQSRNLQDFGGADWIDIHVDAGGLRARRIIERLLREQREAARIEH